MSASHSASTKPEAAGAAPATQMDRMRAAVDKAVSIGPSFLRGEIDANRMANTMIHAVQDYVQQEQAAGGDGVPHGREAEEMQQVLGELMGCGSGFLAGRCDAACVARTMTEMVNEFGTH